MDATNSWDSWPICFATAERGCSLTTGEPTFIENGISRADGIVHSIGHTHDRFGGVGRVMPTLASALFNTKCRFFRDGERVHASTALRSDRMLVTSRLDTIRRSVAHSSADSVRSSKSGRRVHDDVVEVRSEQRRSRWLTCLAVDRIGVGRCACAAEHVQTVGRTA